MTLEEEEQEVDAVERMVGQLSDYEIVEPDDEAE